MWKLKIGEGDSPWLRTTNKHVGRQTWEFDPLLGTPEELAAIEEARNSFTQNRFSNKHSSDLLMRLQVFIFFSSFEFYFNIFLSASTTNKIL